MSKTITEFWKPDYGTIGIGSLVWYYYLCGLHGPFLVIDIRHSGYGQASKKKWILFDASTDSHYACEWDYLRIPKEREICS